VEKLHPRKDQFMAAWVRRGGNVKWKEKRALVEWKYINNHGRLLGNYRILRNSKIGTDKKGEKKPLQKTFYQLR